jgi:Lrp/AsnC family transcriptional regulator, leucine-responsive regulatory protein
MEEHKWFGVKNPIKLDLTDKKILDALYLNARAPIAELSNKTGIQRDVIKYRIDKMVNNNVIRYFTPILNPARFGFPIWTWVNIVFQNFDSDEQKKFHDHLMRHDNIVYISRVTGRYNFLIGVGARDLEHFDDIMSKIMSKFSHLIKEYDTSSIIQESKYDYMVGLVIQQLEK